MDSNFSRWTRRAGIGSLALVAGICVAVALGAASWVSSSTADTTPSVYTSTTPSVYTASTPTVDTSTTPSIYTSTTITPYQAAQIAFYKATIIKPLPPVPPIRALPASGWGIGVPVNCEAACVFIGTVIAENIGTWYLDQAADAKTTRVTLGSVTSSGNGSMSPRITIGKQYRSRLLRARRPVRVTVIERITDKRYGFVKSAQRTLVLRPR